MLQRIHGKLTVLGIFVHIILLYSIFDVYYTSPLVKDGIHPQSITNGKGLAERLVIFSADGLRADTFFNHPEKSPFLHKIINSTKAYWGVTISHVPTESRPGHVAMLAGFFEDVSAVASGWKHNPVPFDSIINRSQEAWAFGSPDIVLMFTNNVPHATAKVYSWRLEDFQQEDAARLDRWVFREMEELLNSTDESVTKRLVSNRVVFFLHLLGLDTNGHGHKPYSEKYIDNIAVVDAGIARLLQLLDNFYGDNRTAFIFTSDHGMTDWGSHGAGTEAELVTPLIVWGPGIRGSARKSEITQIDLSPLMSALLGIPIPMNNFGSVPLHVLDATPRYKFQVAYANFRQMLEQYVAKKNEKRAHSLPFMFRDFDKLKPAALSAIENGIKGLVAQNRFEAAAAVCMKWIPIIRAGLIHFHRHDRTLLGIAIASTFVTWMSCVYLITLRHSSSVALKNNDILSLSLEEFYLVGSTFALLLLCGLPFMHAVYLTMPVFLLCICYNANDRFFDRSNLSKCKTVWFNSVQCSETRKKLLMLCLYWLLVAILTAIALSTVVAAFTYRSILSIEFLFLGIVPVLRRGENRDVIKWKRMWAICCFIIAIYPQFPVVGQAPLPAICTLSSLFTSLLIFWLSNYSELSSAKVLFRYHSALHMFAGAILILIDTLVDYKVLLLPLRLLCWISIPLAAILPFLLSSRSVIIRLISWFSSLMLPYALLSLSYESSFMLFLFMLLSIHVRLEFGHMSDNEFLTMSLAERDCQKPTAGVSGTSFSEWLQGLILVILIEAAFFGTGNIASLNSFNPSFLRCFISVFSPFTMTAMLIFKVSLPILAVAFAYAVIVHLKNVSIGKLSMMLLIITDAMALIFFFQLVDEGSWEDIGTSISHYLVCMSLTVIVYLLLNFTEYLLPLSLSNASLHYDGTVFERLFLPLLTLKTQKDIV